MSKESNYVSTNRAKHYLKCHLIFVCKYRKAILVGQLNDDVKRIFESIASKSDFDIEVMETDRDHIHFLIRYIPGLSISQIVRRLKQESTRQIWLLHPNWLRKQYWYQRILWSDGYFACSIGEASPETVRQYILSQG
jgi:putative transposase